MLRTHRLAAVASAFMVLTSAGCTQGSSDTTDAESTPTTTTSSTSDSTSSTPDDMPSYLKKYTPEEQKAYEGALADYERFSERLAEFNEVGKATPAAKTYYRRYTADWQTYWNKLRQFEAQGIRVVGSGQVIRTRPSRIKLENDGSGSIDLRVCGISRGVAVFQGGTPMPQPSPTPTIVKVAMVKLAGEGWWRVLYEQVGAPC